MLVVGCAHARIASSTLYINIDIFVYKYAVMQKNTQIDLESAFNVDQQTRKHIMSRQIDR